jgi:RimJ/RimL family protein N-acetyltransferase
MIQLVPFELHDFPTLISWVDTPRALLLWSGPRQFTFPLDTPQLMVHHYETLGATPRRRVFKAIDEHGRTIGHAEFGGIDARDGIATLCGVLIAPEERRKGHCFAIVRSALQIGFEELRFRRIDLYLYALNRAAIRCYERAGFVREGVLRKTTVVGEQSWDMVVMSILREEWRPGEERT